MKLANFASMRLKIAVYTLLVLLLCSCRPKKVAVGDGDDVYYREKTSTESVSKKSDKTSSKSRPGEYLTGDARALVDEAYSWIGTPYSYGGQSREGTDCSGFVKEVYRRALEFTLPRTTSEQSEACSNIDRDDLQVGDLVFFRNSTRGKISHVGIYVGDGKIVHASSSRGVIESLLTDKYYREHFHHGGRIKGLKLK